MRRPLSSYFEVAAAYLVGFVLGTEVDVSGSRSMAKSPFSSLMVRLLPERAAIKLTSKSEAASSVVEYSVILSGIALSEITNFTQAAAPTAVATSVTGALSKLTRSDVILQRGWLLGASALQESSAARVSIQGFKVDSLSGSNRAPLSGSRSRCAASAPRVAAPTGVSRCSTW